MKTYSDILEVLLRSVEKRTGQKPETIGSENVFKTGEAMCREGICQVLAKESHWIRWKTLFHHPRLIIPYLIRIRRTKK